MGVIGAYLWFTSTPSTTSNENEQKKEEKKEENEEDILYNNQEESRTKLREYYGTLINNCKEMNVSREKIFLII